jgi:hypothetical protein
MKKTAISLEILKLLLIFLLVYTVATGLFAFLGGGYIEFPCIFIRGLIYDPVNNCFKGIGWSIKEGVKVPPKIEVFLSTYISGWYGEGCHYEKSDANSLEIKTSIGKFNLGRMDGDLKVNGKLLREGERLQFSRIFTLDPWSIAQAEIENSGLVSYCYLPSTEQTLVIIGNYGTELSFVKGSLILLIICIALFITDRISRKISYTI